MITKRDTEFGDDLIESLGEVVAHLRGDIDLPTYEIVPNTVDVAALRKRMKMSQVRFAKLFGFSPRAIQDWEQGRRQPERSARVLLQVINKNPKMVLEALHEPA